MKNSQRNGTTRQKIATFTVRTSLTVFIGLVVLISVFIAGLIAGLLETVFPTLKNIPQLIQVNILSLLIAVFVGTIVGKMFSNPIRNLLDAMKKVADGNFDIKLENPPATKEMREIFEQFNIMVDELRSTEVLKSDFVSNVSHEFKTPINAIEGYTTLLQGTDNIDEVENSYIEKILLNTKRLSSLVNNILLLSKIENQTIQDSKSEYALDEQIREAILALESLWSVKNIDFDADLDDIRYYGNENQMYHVWSNLISNAVKFSPDGGIIKLCLTQNDKNIIFTIDDEGVGISEETKKHIFDKFYQGDTSHKQEGNGLGLTLVKQILSLNDDKIDVENLPEKGCRFTVILNVNTPKK
ncbi:MAG: HAMP domain-containing histidine kinase [Clostridiales bacterium]|nr:HAMP domain-containing histidine kinase [Clostridiales bacterium]